MDHLDIARSYCQKNEDPDGLELVHINDYIGTAVIFVPFLMLAMGILETSYTDSPLQRSGIPSYFCGCRKN